MAIVLVMLPDGEWFDICIAMSLALALEWSAWHCTSGDLYRVICDERGIDYTFSK